MKVRDILENRTEWMPSLDYDIAVPVVSVLLPTWKRAKNGLFEAAVKSVREQSFREWELIIVDDCSTDGTFDIIQKAMCMDPRISCIRHSENIGLPAISEFEAYQRARGTYIMFMFDDNEWEPDAMQQLVEYAEKYNVKAVAGTYLLFSGKPGDSFDAAYNWSILGGSGVNLCNLLTHNCFGNGAVLLHKDTINTVGFLDPNISLSRFWDWDLWQRIARQFQFEMVDIMVGKEKGSGLDDSLGNTHQQFQWAAQERMHQPRNQELLPSNYFDCDIFDTTLQSSPYLYRSNCWIAKQYEKKAWYDADDPALITIKQKSLLSWKGKRIAFLTPTVQVNASTTLIWGRLPYSYEYVILYSSLHWFAYTEWILADVIIIERDLSESADIVIEWAKKMGITCLFYIDDNFNALAVDYQQTKHNMGMKSLADHFDKEHLQRFDYVFCSTNELAQYILTEKYCNKAALMEPIMDVEQLQSYHKPLDTVHFAFVGSFIRGEVLTSAVFPALLRISEARSVRLYCPEETYTMICESIGKGGEISSDSEAAGDSEEIRINERFLLCSYRRTLSLDVLLRRLGQEGIQIQLHCGPKITNNKYKTVNALLNAVCLGATLIATDDSPYSDIQSGAPVCLLAENTVAAWEAAIKEMLDPDVHQSVYRNALLYCTENFKAEKDVNSLVNALHGMESCELIDLNKRLVQHAQYLCSSLRNTGITAKTTCSKNNSLTTDLFLCSLSSRKLRKAMHAVIPNWSENGSKLFCALPLQLSNPLAQNEYMESRLPKKQKSISVVVLPNAPTRILFEFVSSGQIVSQHFEQVDSLGKVSLSIPKTSSPVRLRIANYAGGGMLYILHHSLFGHSVFAVNAVE